ncbi:MAG: diguanylate cyclase [Candidatus Obscuribacter sp.]|nr:diguanylate cyclase [Candidatus Melainabacteria bacterium]MDX1988956.1 diguanylate cyclase [Candidatus Obscuribacter sp.]
MTSESNILPRLLQLQKGLFASLKLKEVLDSAVALFTELAGGAKVAVFLCDNESTCFKLMAAKGYTDGSLDQMKVIPFAIDSMLKSVHQRRVPIACAEASQAPDFSATIMRREASKGQIALPLVSGNLLVGAVLLEVNNPQLLSFLDFLKEVSDLVATAISNSILFGRSEYERERLNTLYKTSCALNSNALEVGPVLKIAADTALVLGNTPTCAILLLDEGGEKFQLAAFKGLDGPSLSEFDMSFGKSIAGSCLRAGHTEVYGDGQREPFGMPRAMSGRPFASVLAIPLISGERKIGVLEVFSTESRAFHREHQDLLESLAAQVSAALNIALSHESASLGGSILDAHTGLVNRVHFEAALVKELERSQRHSHNLSVLLVDIDHLSQINEMLGQMKGDDAIKHVAGTIKSSLRDIDVPSRFGGEEFAVILPETAQEHALEVADRLRQKLRQAPAPGIGLITVSVGIASFPGNADNLANLMRDAEQALNVAKYEGRDRVKTALTGSYKDSGALSGITWEELAKQARMAVISERQARLQSRLTATPEYATWLSKPGALVGKKKGL